MCTRQRASQSELKLCEQAYNNAQAPQAFWCRNRKRDKVHGNTSSQRWNSAGKELFGIGARKASCLEVQGLGQPQGEKHDLNGCMTPEEVQAVICRLKRYKAAGIDGSKAEYLLNAEDILTQPLAVIFLQMLSDGVPSFSALV